MADDETFGWVFDSLVGFLKGPVWEAAVLTFIEQKSVVFDPVEGDEEEYRKFHEEYKNLVDTMLGSHMEDLGITPEQFDQACAQTEKNIHSHFRKSLFEQIWAADNFEIFKRMMLQKNLELQLQALDLLAHQYGVMPESFIPDDDYEPSAEEKQVMEAVVKRYEEEVPESQGSPEPEEKEVLKATKVHLQAERNREKKLKEKAMENSINDAEKSEKDDQPLVFSKAIEVAPEEAKRRQEYLRAQRDRLLALKRQEREKQLKMYEEVGSSRPKSARAAQRAVQQTNEEQSTEIDPKMLAFRKSLAARLKAEVVEKKKEE